MRFWPAPCRRSPVNARLPQQFVVVAPVIVPFGHETCFGFLLKGDAKEASPSPWFSSRTVICLTIDMRKDKNTARSSRFFVLLQKEIQTSLPTSKSPDTPKPIQAPRITMSFPSTTKLTLPTSREHVCIEHYQPSPNVAGRPSTKNYW